jgi:hypothetical protein
VQYPLARQYRAFAEEAIMFASVYAVRKSVVVAAAIGALSLAAGCSTMNMVTKLDTGKRVVVTKNTDMWGVSSTISFLPPAQTRTSSDTSATRVKQSLSIDWKYDPITSKTVSTEVRSEIEAALLDSFNDQRVHIDLPNSVEFGYDRVRQHNSRYTISGIISEYSEKQDQYGTAPVVSMVISVVNTLTGKEIYTSMGTRQGRMNATLASTANELATEMARNVVTHSHSFPTPSKSEYAQHVTQATTAQ